MRTCYFHTTNFNIIHTTLVVPPDMFPGRPKYRRNSAAAGAFPRTPLGKLTSGRRRKKEQMEKQREGRNDEKELQCPECLTWKVDNPRMNRRRYKRIP